MQGTQTPRRSVVLPARGICVGFTAIGLLAGCLTGLLSATGASAKTSATVFVTVRPTPTEPVFAAALDPSPEPAPSTSAPTATPSTPTAAPASASPSASVSSPPVIRELPHVDDPTADPSLSLWMIEQINYDGRATTSLRMRPAQLVSGPAATAYYLSQGQQPRRLAVTAAPGGALKRVKVTQGSTLWGENLLTGGRAGGTPQRLTEAGFVQGAQAALQAGSPIPVWIRKEGTTSVIYLAEQSLD